MGRIALIVAPGRSLRRGDLALLQRFADRAAPAFQNAALAAALRGRADELARQDAELSAARGRLVTAAVIEREQVAESIRSKVVSQLEDLPESLAVLHDRVLTDPAGTAEALIRRLIGFDMGGTSTDVSHYAGAFELSDESVVAGVRIRAPMMQINTVAAGGGSICRFDGMRFRVGPESAGASPGPACYRNGGPLTVTDCNLFLDRIDPAQFPAVFGPEGDQPLDRAASAARLQEVADQLDGAKSLDEIARGFLDIAVDNMAAAIRKISIARGHDVTRYTLACFGGAGGQHACAVADALGIERILVHPLAGVLSAYGIGIADVKAIRETSWLKPLDEDFSGALRELDRRAHDALIEQGLHGERIELLPRARLRTAGSDTTLELRFPRRSRCAASSPRSTSCASAIGTKMPRSSSTHWSSRRLAGRRHQRTSPPYR